MRQTQFKIYSTITIVSSIMYTYVQYALVRWQKLLIEALNQLSANIMNNKSFLIRHQPFDPTPCNDYFS